MNLKNWHTSFFSAVRSPVVHLITAWITGLISGYCLCLLIECSVNSLMGSVVISRTSIVGLIIVLVIPMMISYFAVRYHLRYLIYLTAFFEALILGFCSSAVYLAYGNAGWLVRSLLLFSGSICSVAHIWLWLRQVSGKRRAFRVDFAVCMGVVALTGVLDYLIVSPYLVSLLIF